MPEPIQDIAAIGHVELLTPDPDGSLRFFHEVLGLDIEAREGQSVFLRGYADYQRYSLKLTEAPQPGIGHVGLRAWSDAALERRVAAVEATGLGIGWIEGDHGHGRAYRFNDPDGHLMELYYDSDRFAGPRESKATLKNTPSPYRPRGCGVPRFDHVNMLASDVRAVREFAMDTLGYRLHEQIIDGDEEIGAWMSRSIFSHELIYVVDRLSSGRLHHIAFWMDTREEILRAADVFLDADIYIEAAPSKHTIAQAFFLYGIEPGGNRIELVNGGYFVRDPDWEPVVWNMDERNRGQAWGVRTVESFHTYGTPPLEGQSAPTFGTAAVG
jgi:catechol 2,3-dioxygenase